MLTVTFKGKWPMWVLASRVTARSSQLIRLLWLKASEAPEDVSLLDAEAERRCKEWGHQGQGAGSEPAVPLRLPQALQATAAAQPLLPLRAGRPLRPPPLRLRTWAAR